MTSFPCHDKKMTERTQVAAKKYRRWKIYLTRIFKAQNCTGADFDVHLIGESVTIEHF